MGSYSEDATEWMVNIGARMLEEGGNAEALCPDCFIALQDTDEPDYKRCSKCGEHYWVVVGYSGDEEIE